MYLRGKFAIVCVVLGAFHGYSTSVSAASHTCDVTISEVLLYGSGVVNVKHSGRNDYTHICNLTTSRANVGVQVCAMWVSTLLSMKQTGKSVRFMYDLPAGVTCASLPLYDSAPAPIYIGAYQ